MAGAVIGIAAGMALSVGMITIMSSFDRTIDLTFSVVDRSDVTVTFTEAMSDKAILELQRMPGIIEVEPVRIVPAVLRNGRSEEHTSELQSRPHLVCRLLLEKKNNGARGENLEG